MAAYYDTRDVPRRRASLGHPLLPRAAGAAPSRNARLVDAATGEVIAEAGKKITPRMVKKMRRTGTAEVLVPFEDIIGRFAADDIVNEETGEI